MIFKKKEKESKPKKRERIETKKREETACDESRHA